MYGWTDRLQYLRLQNSVLRVQSHLLFTKLLPPANEVWGKVMFLHLCVILFMGGGGSAHPSPVGRPRGLGRPPQVQTPLGRPPRVVETPWMQTPHGVGQTPLDADPRGLAYPPGCRPPVVGQTSPRGWPDPHPLPIRSTSYWNAYLLWLHKLVIELSCRHI